MSEAFGEKLRRLRLKRGETLESLAEKVGSKKAYIWQLENKSPARPSGELLLKLSNVLAVSPDYLLDDSSKEPSDSQMADALLRKMKNKNISTSDLDKILQIIDAIKNDADKGSK